ncbi:MAG: hypothetical protein R3F48_14815 [Candidatus Zixiibacteriota bacterium]
MGRFRVINIILIALVLCAVSAQCAETFDATKVNPPRDLFYGTIGFGGAEKLSMGLGLVYIHGKHMYTFGYTANDDIHLFSSNYEEEECVHFMYGRCYRMKYGLFSLSAGLGLVTGTVRQENATSYIDKYTDFGPNLGLPIQAQAIWRPTPVIGLGAKLFGNINSKNSYGGMHICLIIGKIWD